MKAGEMKAGELCHTTIKMSKKCPLVVVQPASDEGREFL